MQIQLLPKRPGPFFAHIALYIAVVWGVVYLRQNALLYHPTVLMLDEVLHSAKGPSLQLWPQVQGYRALLAPLPAVPVRGTVVVFHGNAGSVFAYAFYAKALGRLGYRTLLAEYPAFGARQGELGETSLVADARETLRMAHESFGQPLYVIGQSLGAGVAAAAVAHSPVPIAGVAVLTPWDTLPDLAQDKFWYLRARWLVRDSFDSIANLNQFSGRVAVGIASDDEVSNHQAGRNSPALGSAPQPFGPVPAARTVTRLV